MYAVGISRYFIDRYQFEPLNPCIYQKKIHSFMYIRWNQLDVSIAMLSIIGIGLEEVEGQSFIINPTVIRVMRVLRIARVLKLLKMAKGIRALLNTVMQALPQVGNLGLLFFLLFFIFSALGVEMFGGISCDEQYPCEGLGEHAHFRTFGMAFLTLFRIATGEVKRTRLLDKNIGLRRQLEWNHERYSER